MRRHTACYGSLGSPDWRFVRTLVEIILSTPECKDYFDQDFKLGCAEFSRPQLGGDVDLDAFSPLIGAIYDAVLDPLAWSQLARTLAAAFDSESCGLQTRDLVAGTTQVFSITGNVEPKMAALYEAHYCETDLWVAGAARLPADTVIVGTDVASETALLRSEYYNDWAKASGMFHLLGAVTAVDPHTIGIIGIHRSRDADAFDADRRRLLNRLLPHLRRALQLHRRLDGLGRERRLALDAIEALAVGLLVVDADRRLLFANAKAERVLRDGTALIAKQGFLRARNPIKDGRIGSLIREAAQAAEGALTGSGGVTAVPREDGSRLSLLVAPLRPDAMPFGPARAMALIFVGDSRERASTPPGILVELYGLTPAEARLTAALLVGEQLDTYAEKAGITRETARSLLKRIFGKTGCSRQADLIRDALADPAIRAAATAIPPSTQA